MARKPPSSPQTNSSETHLTSTSTAATPEWICSLCGQPGQWWWEVCQQTLCLCERCYTLNRQRRFDDLYQSILAN